MTVNADPARVAVEKELPASPSSPLHAPFREREAAHSQSARYTKSVCSISTSHSQISWDLQDFSPPPQTSGQKFAAARSCSCTPTKRPARRCCSSLSLASSLSQTASFKTLSLSLSSAALSRTLAAPQPQRLSLSLSLSPSLSLLLLRLARARALSTPHS
eukprot:2270151-Rhodomonas_salina.1